MCRLTTPFPQAGPYNRYRRWSANHPDLSHHDASQRAADETTPIIDWYLQHNRQTYVAASCYNHAMHVHHQATIDKLRDRFHDDARFVALVIIGSVARGEARPDSDVDFFLICTPDEYQKRRTTRELTIDAHDLADYPDGQAGGTIVDMRFIEEAAAKAPEPTRFAFSDAMIAFSHHPDTESLIKRIATYQESERAEKMKSFVSQLPVHLSYMYLADYSSNPYLLAETAVELVLFGGRLILAHNRMLYPNRKQFMSQLEKAPDKPEHMLDLATELLTHPGIATAQPFYDAIMNFFPWPQPPEGAMARFKNDREQNWQLGNTPLADS